MANIKKLPHYTPAEFGFLLFFLPLLFLADLQLRVQSSRKILNVLTRNRPALVRHKAVRPCRLPPQRLFQLLEIADRRMHRVPSCVRQALVLSWLLRWFKLDTRIQIGVRLTGSNLEAHTWLEHDGIPLQTIQPSLYHPLTKME